MSTKSPSFVHARASEIGHPNTVAHVFRSLAARANIHQVKLDYLLNIGPGKTVDDSNAWCRGYAPSGLTDFFTAPITVTSHDPDYTTMLRYYFKERTDYNAGTDSYAPKSSPFRQLYVRCKLTSAHPMRLWLVDKAVEDASGLHGGSGFVCVEITAHGHLNIYRSFGVSEFFNAINSSMLEPSSDPAFLVHSDLNDYSTPFRSDYDYRLEVQISVVRQSDWQVAQVCQVWFNRTLIASALIDVRPFPITPESKFGFYNLNSIQFQCNTGFFIREVEIPQLSDMVEWHSIDPGESPDQALSRAIEGRNLKRYARFDGTLAAFRSQDRAVSETYNNRNNAGSRPIFSFRTKVDKRDLYSHVRMVGAWEQAEYVDVEAARVVGTEFRELKNPYLEDESECFFEAINAVRRMKENAFTASGTSPIHPFLERDDVVVIQYYNSLTTWRANYYFVDELGVTFGGNGARFQSLSLRGNFYAH